MVEKTRRSLTVLRRCQEADREELNYWIRRYSDAEELKKGATSGQSRQQSPAVQENAPSGWGSHLSHPLVLFCSYRNICALLFRCQLCLQLQDHLYVFGCPQKFTGSFCTGRCLDMFLRKSGRKLVSLRSSPTHKHICASFCKDLCRQDPMTPNSVGPKKLLARSSTT